eukprot:15072578-Ditylum_brightwellii.AAC.1
MEGTDIEELEEHVKKQKKNTKSTRDKLHEAHSIYEEFGNYCNKNSTTLKKKLILKHLPLKHDQICGGLSGGAYPRLCTSRECNIIKHSKNRYGLKIGHALYPVLVGNLVYSIPVCRRDNLHGVDYYKLQDTTKTLLEAGELRKKLNKCNQVKSGKVICDFLKIPTLTSTNLTSQTPGMKRRKREKKTQGNGS